MIVAGVLAVLCVFDVAAWAYGAKVHLVSFLDPIRAEAREMCHLKRIPIINAAVEQQAFLPVAYSDNLVLRKNPVLFVTTVPVWTNNEFRKISIFSVGRPPIWDRIRKDYNVCP